MQIMPASVSTRGSGQLRADGSDRADGRLAATGRTDGQPAAGRREDNKTVGAHRYVVY